MGLTGIPIWNAIIAGFPVHVLDTCSIIKLVPILNLVSVPGYSSFRSYSPAAPAENPAISYSCASHTAMPSATGVRSLRPSESTAYA